jgi:hypothetical protein
MPRFRALIALLTLLGAVIALPASAQSLPEPRVAEETASLSLRDFQGADVILRIPLALHRPANAFRLYGIRPLTLKDRGRRKDLYRDAFLELATRSRLSGEVTAWDTLSKQVDWLTKPGNRFLFSPPPALPAPTPPSNCGPNLEIPALDAATRSLGDVLQRAAATPGFNQLSSLTQALGEGATPQGTLEPLIATLKLRALATDDAEKRLADLGAALPTGRGVDPALREGYLAARQEFIEVRQGLWPAIGASVRKNQGRLLLSAAKELVLSRVGFWAIFGQLGWSAAEATLSSEHQGQYAIAVATIAQQLAESARQRPELLPQALYSELVLQFQLTEALKQGQIMALKPAGGRDTAGWQIHCSERCEELKRALFASARMPSIAPPATTLPSTP